MLTKLPRLSAFRATAVAFNGPAGPSRGLRSLVIADHDNNSLLPNTLSAVTAAKKLGGEIDILVAGSNKVASSAAAVDGVSKVISLENANLTKRVAEDLAKAIQSSGLIQSYTHIISSSSNTGKNFFPRLAALADASPATDVLEIVDDSTVKRPMYAGNAIATVKMSDAIKVYINSIMNSYFHHYSTGDMRV
jgi:electron transfer flavoprotein alpha subunit